LITCAVAAFEKTTQRRAMASFQIISDSHLEFFDDLKTFYDKVPLVPKAPICCLLGDIGYPNQLTYRQFVADQAARFQTVLIVAGNHEYYKSEYHQVHARIQELCLTFQNVHFLNRTTFEVDDVIFAGTTLWTDIDEKGAWLCNDYKYIYYQGEGEVIDNKQENARDQENEDYEGEEEAAEEESSDSVMNEKADDGKADAPEVAEVERINAVFSKLIKKKPNYKRITPEKVRALHQEDVEWIKKQINNAKARSKRLVLLTHHAPTGLNTLDEEAREQGPEVQTITYTNLEHLFGPPLAVWCFGHTHWSSDQIIRGTRVISNQVGYLFGNYEDQSTYDQNQIIDPKADVKNDVMKRAWGVYEPKKQMELLVF